MIQINAKTFADALTLVSGAVERKSTIPILGNVRIDGDWRRGTLRLEGTDLETALSVTVPAQVVAEIHLTVPARELLAFVKTIDKGETVSLRSIASTLRVFVAGGVSAEFASMDLENWPEMPAAPAPSAMIPGAVLANALRKTMFPVALEGSRYTLDGALFEIKGESLTVVSTDGHRLSHYSSADTVASTADFKGIISKPALLLAEKMLKRSKGKGEAQLAELTIPAPEGSKREAERIVFVWIGEALLTVRLLSGQFPDYERVIPSRNLGENTATVDRKQFTAALKQVGRFADERSHAVRFAVNGSFEIAASGTEAGSGKVSIPVRHVGLDVERVGFNPRYLLDVLAAIDSERVTLDFGKPIKHDGTLRECGEIEWGNALLVAADSAKFVVMPMRV
jgi:DNA polymerase-3 subunit beta